MGFTEILTIVFVVLKALGKIDWPWIYVFLPEIIAGGIYILICLAVIIQNYRAHKEIKRLFDKDL